MFYVSFCTDSLAGSLIATHQPHLHTLFTVFENDPNVLKYSVGHLTSAGVVNWDTARLRKDYALFRNAPLTKHTTDQLV